MFPFRCPGHWPTAGDDGRCRTRLSSKEYGVGPNAPFIKETIMKLKQLFCIAPVLFFVGAGAAHAQSETSTLGKIKKEGVMKVCYAQGSPESYKDPKTGEWLGVFVELANELATWMKVKIQPVEVQWNTAVLALKRGDCDFFGSSFVYNAPRAMEVN